MTQFPFLTRVWYVTKIEEAVIPCITLEVNDGEGDYIEIKDYESTRKIVAHKHDVFFNKTNAQMSLALFQSEELIRKNDRKKK